MAESGSDQASPSPAKPHGPWSVFRFITVTRGGPNRSYGSDRRTCKVGYPKPHGVKCGPLIFSRHTDMSLDPRVPRGILRMTGGHIGRTVERTASPLAPVEPGSPA
jgi:hypothetical protein